MNDVAPLSRTVPQRPIKPLDAKEFGKGAELKERLMSILRDVPVLHERLTKVITEMERVKEEFKAATDRAKSIVDEWEQLNKEEKR